ncbi:zinc ABC transporter substrate-binding protein [Oscillatoriales cyanobacterium LEGE 11467]|uniref:Zinc ABC transporter substrate-binding protein n=1 Tax=Zarconia navalis LEGE 11467 TaxID=1828826 RepID=A0A928VWH9_9CYAN|nr:zinc ABC transporter substrate-binding protein [Zarconia navalis]MBE9041532.1 zinc ABC transporter substrate-binding protein [Zarconia navalis LEGE 11467]
MKRSFCLFTALAVLGGASTLLLGNRAAHSQASPQVVASYSVLCDLTEQIARDTLEVTCLIEAGEDPHIYNATPADRRAIEAADLILYGGYGFEPGIIRMVEAIDRDIPQIAVAEAAVTEPLLGAAHDRGRRGYHDRDDHDHGDHDDHDHDDHDDHDHGDHDDHDHGDHDEHGEEDSEPDPHVWHDAENGIAMVRIIQTQLSEAFPDNADLYQANAQTLIAQLTQLDTWIEQQVETVPESQRVLVTTHDALGYYAEAYGIRIEAALESFSTEARPSAADLRELIEIVEDRSVPTVFIESTSNPRLIEAVSRETDIGISEEPLYADSLGEAGTPAATYTGMLMTNTCTIVSGLGGRCDEATAQAFLD